MKLGLLNEISSILPSRFNILNYCVKHTYLVHTPTMTYYGITQIETWVMTNNQQFQHLQVDISKPLLKNKRLWMLT